MSEPVLPPAVPQPGAPTLKQLRLAQGIELEALASAIKVSPAKLEALENGRFDQFPNAAFTRALAMSVCRVLKVDATAVLANLPQARPVNLADGVSNQVPFKPNRARLNLDVSAAIPWRQLLSLRWLAPAAVLIAAALVYFWPQDVQWHVWGVGDWTTPVSSVQEQEDVGTPMAASTAVPQEVVASAASMPELVQADASASAPTVAASGPGVLASAPVPTPVASASAMASAAHVGSALVLVSTDPSWVEVRDAQGVRLLSRQVTAGETIGIDGSPPLSVKIGNAAGVRLSYQGNPIELEAFSRGNVARLELK